MIEQTDLQTLLTALVAVILAIIAWYNKQRTATAATTAAATTQTAITNQAMAISEKAPVLSPANGFSLPRDGKYIVAGVDGWNARINPDPVMAGIPDDRAYQAISPGGRMFCGDKDAVIFLITNPDAAGWRARHI